MGINVNEVFIANEQSPQKFQLDAAKFDYYCKENGIKEENIAELKKSMQEYFAGYNNLSWDRFRRFSNNLGEYIASKVSGAKSTLASSSLALQGTSFQAPSVDEWNNKAPTTPKNINDFQRGTNALVEIRKYGWRTAQLNAQIAAYTN